MMALVCMMIAAPDSGAVAAKKLVAHRGASAYAPEHTLASYRLALQQKADYVEQDLAVTKDLMRQLPSLPRTFLIDNRDGQRWLNDAGFAEIATFATGIGPAKGLLDGHPEIVRSAHAHNLTVTPYTFTTRFATGSGRFTSVGDEMRYYLADLDVDALFTDNPDRFPR